jgi:2'-5' RNA ligase
VRVFIAVPLPANVRRRIAELIADLKSAGAAVKWVEEENLHVTLKFFGEVAEGKAGELGNWLASRVGGTGGFEIKLAGMGTFPAGKHPRVVWVGVDQGKERMAELARSLDEPEFVPHVTIGRIKDKGVIRLKSVADLGVAPVTAVQLIKSKLTPKGPVYEILREVKL